MLGGEWFEKLFGSPDEVSIESIIGVAREELRLHLGITSDPTETLGRIHKVNNYSKTVAKNLSILYNIIVICTELHSKI